MENWINNQNDSSNIVLGSKIRLVRNISGMPFPNKISFVEGRKNGKLIYDILSKEIQDDEFTIYEMWEDSEDTFKKFIEEYLITNKLIKNSNRASFILNKNKTISIMINEEDHINLQCMTAGLDLNEALKNAIAIDTKIENNISYAFDDELGYLTSSLSNLGTGLKASVLIHLPALTMNQEIKNIEKDFDKLGIDIKGVYFKDEKVIGSLYVISNKETSGVTEEEIIEKVKDATLSIVLEEKKYREILLGKCKYELEDKVFRSYGILKSAVLLEFDEMLELLSNVRLGVELSLIDIDKNKLNEILVKANKFSLQSILDKTLDIKESKYERAKLIKEILI